MYLQTCCEVFIELKAQIEWNSSILAVEHYSTSYTHANRLRWDPYPLACRCQPSHPPAGGPWLGDCLSLSPCFVSSSNGNASETKANESFDNSVFFDIEAKQTLSLEIKLFSKQSEHIR
jgi:hypothetical protein